MRLEMRVCSNLQAPAEVAHPVEHQFPKLKAAGSSPVFRSLYFLKRQIGSLLKQEPICFFITVSSFW